MVVIIRFLTVVALSSLLDSDWLGYRFFLHEGNRKQSSSVAVEEVDGASRAMRAALGKVWDKKTIR